MQANSLWFEAPGRVAWREVELAAPSVGEVLIKTEWSGISAGTEMLAFRGELDPAQQVDEKLSNLSGTFTYPFRYGYSCVGTVIESSAGPAEGARVFAFHPHQDLIVAPASDVIEVDVPARSATLLPLVETAVQVVMDCGARIGEVVVVAGLGAVGMLTALFLVRAGATVIAVDPKPLHRKVAKSLGIEVADVGEAPGAVDTATRGRGADFVIECSGRPAALQQALDLLATEGTAVVASWYGNKPVTLDLGGAFHRRRLTIRSTQVSTIPTDQSSRWNRARRMAVTLQTMRDLPLDQLATHDFGWDRAGDAYAAIERGEDGLIHAALRYQ